MMNSSQVSMVVGGVMLAGTALAQPAVAENTPLGPASLKAETLAGPVATERLWGGVVTKWQVGVGEGGQAGIVRLKLDPSWAPGAVVGDPVELPAAPGTYTFPAPHVYTPT